MASPVALQLAAASGAAIGDGAARALVTVRQVLPARLRHRVDAVQFTPSEGAPGPARTSTPMSWSP